MKVFYKSTRGIDDNITSSEAIVKGIANDGGLFVPTEFPIIDKPLFELVNMNYKELAFYLMKKYLADFKYEELMESINKAYDDKFQAQDIAPIKEANGVHFLELYHGPTLAFKDMALSILPYLLKNASKKLNLNKEIIILTATSGDTGKAALEGFVDVEDTKIVVFFPEDGVSDIQKRQMVTQEGENTFVIGIEGNFDDAQKGVKEIFGDVEFNNYMNKNNYILSSANSINIGRLVPQIVYYFYAYLNLLKQEKISNNEQINIVVPTGNFGNILAAFYAKKMGLPINKLICASNENNVLTDFINSGVYDKKREFIKTISPSMDILVSSNIERLLYELSGHNEKLINAMMEKLYNTGNFEITPEMKKQLKEDFYSGFATEEETYTTIKNVYESSNYVIDTHTAVAYCVYEKYRNDTHDNCETIVVSTASPFKFTRSVYKALFDCCEKNSDFKLIEKLANSTGLIIPKTIKNIENKKVLHNSICRKNGMKLVVKKILKI